LAILTSPARPAGQALGHRRKRISRTGTDRPWSASGESTRASISSAWLLSATTSSTRPSWCGVTSLQLVQNGIPISMDGKGAWRDDVFERLWRSVKYEEVYLRAYDSVSEARTSIGR
jgi:hypothetical protein